MPSSSAKAGDPVLRAVRDHHRRLGILDAPPSRGMTIMVGRPSGQTAKTRTPYHHRRAAAAPRNHPALRTPRPWLPPPPAAPPASASRRRAGMPALSRQAFLRRADRGTPARTVPSDVPGRDEWRRGGTLL